MLQRVTNIHPFKQTFAFLILSVKCDIKCDIVWSSYLDTFSGRAECLHRLTGRASVANPITGVGFYRRCLPLWHCSQESDLPASSSLQGASALRRPIFPELTVSLVFPGSVHPMFTVTTHPSYSSHELCLGRNETSPSHSQMSRNSSRKSSNSLRVNQSTKIEGKYPGSTTISTFIAQLGTGLLSKCNENQNERV